MSPSSPLLRGGSLKIEININISSNISSRTNCNPTQNFAPNFMRVQVSFVSKSRPEWMRCECFTTLPLRYLYSMAVNWDWEFIGHGGGSINQPVAGISLCVVLPISTTNHKGIIRDPPYIYGGWLWCKLIETFSISRKKMPNVMRKE